MDVFLFFITGLFFGSFANVVSLRLHSKKPGIMTGKSECPKCGHILSFWENIPLFSWIVLRGRCRTCQKSISWQYPAVELFFGLLFAGTAFFVGREDVFLIGFDLVLIFALGTLAVSDLRFFEIPDEVSLPAIAFALVGAFFSVNIPIFVKKFSNTTR